MNARPPAPIRSTDRRRQLGMTLLELLVVVALMSAVGFMALSQVGDDLGQARYQDTENRLEMIRKAIIGDTSRTLNGQPEIRGFVADMGRRPANLLELIEQPSDCNNDLNVNSNDYCDYVIYDGHCSDPNPAIQDESNCIGAGGIWYPDFGGIWAGWNGPYLTGTDNTFRDGWGNENVNTSEDDINFGWLIRYEDTNNAVDRDSNGNPTDDEDEIRRVVSLGLDGMEGSQYGNDYEGDYSGPTPSGDLTVASDYNITITGTNGNGGLPVDFGLTQQYYSNYCANRIHYTNETACTNAGGIWNDSICSFSNQSSCSAASGTWVDVPPPACTFSTAAACVSANGSWNINATPQCTFTESACTNAGGTWNSASCTNKTYLTEPDCIAAGETWIPSQCIFGTKPACLTAGGAWSQTITLCARLFRPVHGNVPDINNPLTIESNNQRVVIDGNRQIIEFQFSSGTLLPQGVRGIGIYWYNNSGSGTCTEAIFPSGRRPIRHSFIARSAVQPIQWPLN